MNRDEILQGSELSESHESLNAVTREFFLREFSRISAAYASCTDSIPAEQVKLRARRMLTSDQEFLDTDLLPPIFKSALLILSQGGDTTTFDAADQFFDSLVENGEGIESSSELLSSGYLKNLVDNNLNDAKEFLNGVASGNIVF